MKVAHALGAPFLFLGSLAVLSPIICAQLPCGTLLLMFFQVAPRASPFL